MSEKIKIRNLWGDEDFVISKGNSKQKTDFEDHNGFVEKFKTKLTTDDCYTPEAVMAVIDDYVSTIFDMTNKTIMRPFKPGGDYVNEIYHDNAVVIDNPPFSILSQIIRFYMSKNIPFFLFAPHLTIFNYFKSGCSFVICDASIIYKNGANVKTSFVTNLFDDSKIVTSSKLQRDIKAANKKTTITFPRYKYPSNVLTVSRLAVIVNKGVNVEIPTKKALFVKGLDDQKKHKKAIFGGGLLLSNATAAELAAAELADDDDIIEWKLSNRELNIIKSLK